MFCSRIVWFVAVAVSMPVMFAQYGPIDTTHAFTNGVQLTVGPGVQGNGLVTTYQLAGDFDVQVHYILLNWPAKNLHSVRIGAADLGVGPGGGIGLNRSSFSNSIVNASEFYLLALPNAKPQIATTDTSGILRIVRSGSVLSGYANGTLVGSGTVSTVPTHIYIDIGGGDPLAKAGTLIEFDNFVVNSGTPANSNAPPLSSLGSPSSSNRSGFSSEPVNTATGNYFTTMTDLAVPGRGLRFVFTRSYNSADIYSGPLGPGWTHSFNQTLTVNADTSVSIKEGDGGVITFAPSGPNYVPQTAGVFDSLAKNADGSFTLTRKNRTQLTWSSVPVAPPGTTGMLRLTSIVDRNGNTQALGYTGGNLTTITDSSGRIYELAYDGSGHLTSLTDPLNRSVQYAYDSGGRLISVKDPIGGTTQYAYDASNHLVSAVDARGITYVQNAYDSLGRVVTQKNARNFVTTFAYDTPSQGTTTITDPLGNVTRHVHDSALRLISVIDATGGTIAYSYDANNNRTSVTNQNGKTTTLVYDSQGNITGITDPLGNSRTLTYDSNNNLLSATNPKGKVIILSYDRKGNLRSIRDALGNTTSFTYNTSGLLTSTTDAKGGTTQLTYDAFGDIAQIIDPLGHTSKLSYDAAGRLLAITDPNGHTFSSAHDALSRLVKLTDPLGDQTTFSYDGIGDLLAITDANGNTTSYSYDATSNLVTVTDALSNVTRYAYDANNKRTVFTNAKGNITSYSYDGLNHLVKSVDPLSFVTSYTYDAAGNLISRTDANGATNMLAYDADNRPVTISYADGNRVSYTYDSNGNRTEMTDASGVSRYAYDALDRLLSVTDASGRLVRYGYDSAGNRNSIFYPDGKSLSYDYDNANRLVGVTDWFGRLTAYTYDPAANLIRTRLPNKVDAAFAYDADNRLLQVANSSPSAALPTISYTLDGVGNRLSQMVDGVTTSYNYDRIYQLLTAQQGPQKLSWTYDQVGNRLTETAPSGTTLYAYDADDRLLGAGSTTFSYDRNGNQVSKTDPAGFVKYVYDSANRLVRVTGSGINSGFSYDGDGNRVSQFTRSGTYSYANDIAASLPVVLNEQGPDGAITYAYGASRIEEYSPGFSYFYQSDGLGSEVTLTDASGEPAETYGYDAWGNALPPSSPAVGTRNKFRFTGEALDPETGLYYLRERYYDPAVGRFLSRDPLNTQAPLAFRPYAYANNSPINLIDPSGLAGEPSGMVLGAYTDSPNAVALTLANNLIEALSKDGAVLPNFVEELIKSLAVDLAVSITQKSNLPRTAQLIRDLDTLSTPFLPTLGDAPRRVGSEVGAFTYSAGQWIFAQLNKVVTLQLPPLH